MFRVKGYLNGISYAVQVGIDPARANDGIVAGDPRVMAMLQSQEGVPQRPAPGMTAVPGNNDSSAWVLACLHANTEVTDVDGTDVPDLRMKRRRHDPTVVY